MPPTNNAFTVYPNICAEALRTKHYWAYALVAVCKLQDEVGRGWITETDMSHIQSLYGWSDSKLYRIIKDAEKLGWLSPATDRFYIAGHRRIAKSLGVEHVGRNAVKVSDECLKSNNALRTAFLKAFLQDKSDRPISQAYIRSRTGIPERTQRHYLNRAKDVYRIANYIVTVLRPEDVIGARQNGYEGAFVKDGRVLVQAPNTYIINEGSVSGHGKSTARRINSHLRELCSRGQGETRDARASRLWYNDDKSFFAAMKQADRGKLERRPCYYILSQRNRSYDGLVHIQEYQQCLDPVLSRVAA